MILERVSLFLGCRFLEKLGRRSKVANKDIGGHVLEKIECISPAT